MRTYLFIGSLWILAVVGCDSKIVDRRVNPAFDPKDGMPETLTDEFEKRDFKLKPTVNLLPSAFHAKVTLAWSGSPPNGEPFAIYELGRKVSEKLPFKTAGVNEISFTIEGPKTRRYVAAGKSANGTLWRGDVCELSGANDYEVRTGQISSKEVDIKDRIYLRPNARLISVQKHFWASAHELFLAEDATIESFDTKLDRAPTVEHEQSDHFPARIRLAARKASGKLTVRAWGYDSVDGKLNPQANSPAVFIEIEEPSNIEIVIDSRPGKGGVKNPVCVKNGPKVDQGCDADWLDYKEKQNLKDVLWAP